LHRRSICAVESERLFDGLKQLLIGKRLDEKLDCARLERFADHRHVTVCSHDDDRNRHSRGTELCLEFHPRDARQPNVENKVSRLLGVPSLDKLLGG
jgi:hypothetical protein